MEFTPNNEFTRTKWERQDVAKAHWWARTRKYGTNNYTRWWKTVKEDDGTEWRFCEEPMPRAGNYERVFYGRVLHGGAAGVIPYLEHTFQPDEVDLCYIEGLLLEAEELGLTEKGTAYAMSGEGFNTLWTSSIEPANLLALEQDETAKGRLFLRGGKVIAGRIALARRWIAEKRARASSPTPDTPVPAIADPSQHGTPAPGKGCTHLGYPLDTAPPPLTERLPIDDVLAMPRPALDRVLLAAAMIEPDTTPGRYKAKPTVKPWQWANVRAALQTKLLLAEINDLDAAGLFTETYGAVVGRGTMQQRPQNEQSNKIKRRRTIAYAEFLDRLPAPNPS